MYKLIQSRTLCTFPILVLSVHFLILCVKIQQSEQLRSRYWVEEDLDPGQASESMMLLEDLGSGETLKQRDDSSRAEEPESGADLEREKAQPNTGGHGSRK